MKKTPSCRGLGTAEPPGFTRVMRVESAVAELARAGKAMPGVYLLYRSPNPRTADYFSRGVSGNLGGRLAQHWNNAYRYWGPGVPLYVRYKTSASVKAAQVEEKNITCGPHDQRELALERAEFLHELATELASGTAPDSLPPALR